MNEQVMRIILEELHKYEVDDIEPDLIIDILNRLIDEGYSDKL